MNKEWKKAKQREKIKNIQQIHNRKIQPNHTNRISIGVNSSNNTIDCQPQSLTNTTNNITTTNKDKDNGNTNNNRNNKKSKSDKND